MKTSHLIYHEIFKYFNKNVIILVGLRWNETSWKHKNTYRFVANYMFCCTNVILYVYARM